MRFLICILTLLTSVSAYGWLHPSPDYAKQMEGSDFVAIVRADKISDTGNTKQLDSNSKILFREFEVELRVQFVLKGKAKSDSIIRCRLFRYPNKIELKTDLEEREGMRQYVMSNPWESCLFVPTQNTDYMVFLKKNKSGDYLPVTGVKGAVYSVVQLKVPFDFDPIPDLVDEQVEKNGGR